MKTRPTTHHKHPMIFKGLRKRKAGSEYRQTLEEIIDIHQSYIDGGDPPAWKNPNGDKWTKLDSKQAVEYLTDHLNKFFSGQVHYPCKCGKKTTLRWFDAAGKIIVCPYCLSDLADNRNRSDFDILEESIPEK